jgi:hypothetical protein
MNKKDYALLHFDSLDKTNIAFHYSVVIINFNDNLRQFSDFRQKNYQN